MASIQKTASNKHGEQWRVQIFRRGLRASRTFKDRQEAEKWAERVTKAIDNGTHVAWRKRMSTKQIEVPLPSNQILTEREIIESAGKMRIITGIYFLIRDEKVVYVGQSRSIHERIIRHIRDNRRKFDSFAYVEESLDALDMAETQYIELLRPEYNLDKRGALLTPHNSMEYNLRGGHGALRRKSLHHQSLEAPSIC